MTNTTTPAFELHLGDCLKILPKLEPESVDAVIADPPWMDYKTSRYDASQWHKPITQLAPKCYAKMLHPIVRPGGVVILWCRWDCFQDHADALAHAGFRVKNCIVWAKPNHTAGDLNGNLANKHEMAVFATKGRWLRHSKRETNLWNEPHLFSKTRRHHPTEKPVNLMKRAVLFSVVEGGVVLDPFMGSGTTGVACAQTGRGFVGIEIDPDYFSVAEQLIAEAQMQPRLL